SDIIHQSVMELIHSEDREEFKRQLTWNSMLPSDKSALTLHETMLPGECDLNCRPSLRRPTQRRKKLFTNIQFKKVKR
ncbi:Aryl hydrocarbon receptor, partial [Biomphalaria glabrata]